jgi:hypothetical protein
MEETYLAQMVRAHVLYCILLFSIIIFLFFQVLRLKKFATGANYNKKVKQLMEQIISYDIIVLYSISGKSEIRGEQNKLVFAEKTGIITFVIEVVSSYAETNLRNEVHKSIILFLRRGNQNKARVEKKSIN